MNHPRVSAGLFPLGNERFRGVSEMLEFIFHFFQGPVTSTVQPRPLDVANIANIPYFNVQYKQISKKTRIFEISEDSIDLHETIIMDRPLQSVSGHFPSRKRSFPGCSERFGHNFS